MTHQRKKYATSREQPRRPERVVRDLSVPLDRLSWRVGTEERSDRLDHFLLARMPWRSRNQIHALITGGRVTKNGDALRRKAGRVVTGDLIEVAVPPPTEEVRHEELARVLDALILHDDADLVALAKPAGLIMHPVGRTRVNTLIQGLHWLFRHGPRVAPGVLPRICHRLDRDTSGVVVVAKSMPARVRLQEIFEGRDVEKQYVAVVSGRVPDDAGLIDLPIGPDEDAELELMMTTRPDGLPSRTRYRVLERFAAASLVQFDIETGRQHQIRVHARALGHPVLLDALYGDDTVSFPGVITRQALHARKVVLPHPRTGAPLTLEAPLPPDFEGLLAALRGCPGSVQDLGEQGT